MENNQLSAAELVGQNVRRFRKARHLTLADLSSTMENLHHPIGVATLSKIERGDRPKLAVDDVLALARALDVSTDELLKEELPSAKRVRATLAEMGEVDVAYHR